MVPFKPAVRKVMPIYAVLTFIASLIVIPWMPTGPLLGLPAQPPVALQYVLLMRQNILQ